MQASDVMVHSVVMVTADTEVAEVMRILAKHDISALPVVDEIATLLERKRIKRVPILRDGKVVGIVSRTNLIQALASAVGGAGGHPDSDRHIRDELLARLAKQHWTDFGSRNVTVEGGTVHLWGLISDEAERKALLALAEGVPGVAQVRDEMFAIY